MFCYVLLCIFVMGIVAEKELDLPVTPESQRKLSLSLKNLEDELQYFRTPQQNPLALYNKVEDASKSIDDVRKQLSQYDNVIIGQGNKVNGQKNIIVGNYDSITGSNNFVLVDNYEGSVNGMLLIGKWRIQLEKRQWIKVNPNFAIFFINEEENRKYQRYLNRNRGFTYGSNLNKNTITVIKEVEEEIRSQLKAGLSILPGNSPVNAPGMNNIIRPQGQIPPSLNFAPLQAQQPIGIQSLNQQPFGSNVFMGNRNNLIPSVSLNSVPGIPSQLVPSISTSFGSAFSNTLNNAQLLSLSARDSVIINGNLQPNLFSNQFSGNLRTQQLPDPQMSNPHNSQMRSSLSTRYLRTGYQDSYGSQNVGPFFSNFKAFN